MSKKVFTIPVSYTFNGTVSIPADSEEEAIEHIQKNFSLNMGEVCTGTIDDQDDNFDYNINMTPDETIDYDNVSMEDVGEDFDTLVGEWSYAVAAALVDGTGDLDKEDRMAELLSDSIKNVPVSLYYVINGPWIKDNHFEEDDADSYFPLFDLSDMSDNSPDESDILQRAPEECANIADMILSHSKHDPETDHKGFDNMRNLIIKALSSNPEALAAFLSEDLIHHLSPNEPEMG